jgi:hypothetical protein
MALPPTIQRIAGSRPGRSASSTSSYPASQPNTGLAQHGQQIMPPVPACAAVSQVLLRDGHQVMNACRLTMPRIRIVDGVGVVDFTV